MTTTVPQFQEICEYIYTHHHYTYTKDKTDKGQVITEILVRGIVKSLGTDEFKVPMPRDAMQASNLHKHYIYN